MEGGRKPSSSIAGAAVSSPFFSGRPSSIGSKEASNKHKTESHISNAQGVDSVADRKPQSSPTRRQLTHKRDGKPLYVAEPIESPYFGSSVHYGARDFYATSQSSKTSKNYKSDEGNDLGSPDFATRGEWWQGSLYY